MVLPLPSHSLEVPGLSFVEGTDKCASPGLTWTRVPRIRLFLSMPPIWRPKKLFLRSNFMSPSPSERKMMNRRERMIRRRRKDKGRRKRQKQLNILVTHYITEPSLNSLYSTKPLQHSLFNLTVCPITVIKNQLFNQEI